ncbi:unnamed protein product [Rotaria socialis]|uniref:Uncharacterized protein n=1 Tax=Rotaria socialis TaxID=392032 RepID=A0A818MSF8_9BILA|nr:unnamed protein product [Rotaria socialis]CAF3259023.1 unnamed protein product [Rotaria socialis]CAF3594247.1 unnamed protein product [Rotaria socialis]CAF4236787.1 unnamed protein product [Rotaria socialis]CAF4411401.1 unnamed protein product [Rotaria socialis]
MLKSEYSHKQTIRQTDAKQHLHDIRYQRQNQLKSIVDECHQLRILHKRIFDNQLNSYSAKKPLISMPMRNESIFIISPKIESDDEFPISKEFTIYLSESSYTLLDFQSANHQLASPPVTMNQERCLTVSSVASIDKHTNKVYDKWPDYTEINQMLGFPIQKFPSVAAKPKRPTNIPHRKKQNKSNRFVDAIKQIQNRSSNQRNLLKNKFLEEFPMNGKLVVHHTSKEADSTLPPLVCPLSVYYSKRIRTRQWLCQNDFSTRTLPLI